MIANRKLYVCKAYETITENGNELYQYEDPVPIWCNYQMESNNYVLAIRGEDEYALYFTFVNTLGGVPFHKNDKVYLIDNKVRDLAGLEELIEKDRTYASIEAFRTDESVIEGVDVIKTGYDQNRTNANYRVYEVQMNRIKTKVVFQKI